MHYQGTAYPAELAAVTWRKSSRSGGGDNCVEIARLDARVGVRDSKDPLGPAFVFGTRAWSAFLTEVRTGTIV